MLHNQVSALRRELGLDGRIETHGSAYRLAVNPAERDVDRFEELVASARADLDANPDSAASKLREALGLWRGPVLADLAYEAFAQAEIARLEERRWIAFEARVDAELVLGRHADLVSELLPTSRAASMWSPRRSAPRRERASSSWCSRQEERPADAR
jgi:DNA-binding SARP family transcriptional activator